MYPMFHSSPSRSFSKYQKHFNIGNEDRISHLPEEILSKILSCLPTKQAVAASVLSKRWRNLWTLVTCLDFDDMALIDQDKCAISPGCSLLFRNYVDKVLSGHLNASSSIEKIHFEITAWQDPRKVNHWIRSAVKLNVKELALNFFFQENILVPVTLPASDKLVILKIHSNADITVPASFCLPNAKVIILKYVSISMPHLQALISGSLALEELEIYEYLEQNLFPEKALIISSSTLKRLTLREIDYDATSIQTVLVVHAPNLEFCELSGYVLEEFHKVSLPSLAWMKVDLNGGFFVNLAQFNHVSHLTVLWYAMMVLVESLNDDSNWTPFPNLTHLEVSDNGRSWMVLPAMLKLAPKLQSCIINFKDDEETCPVTKKLWYAPPALPQCLLTSLTRVEFRDFQGRKTQMGAVRYFMKNAERLNQMIIKVDKAVVNRRKKSDLIIEILNFPKGSSTCLIFVI